MMKQFQLITIDVWDTLLRRKCHPDAIKIHVSNFLLNNYFQRLKPEYHDASKLMQERQAAEGRIGIYYRSSGMDDEYNLHEVYRQWLEVVFISAEDSGSIIDTLETVELQQEKHVIYADPQIETFLAAYSSPSRIFVSDFYMSAAKLMELIRHVGLDRLVDRGYSSCDHYLNKRSGRLFGLVHDKEGVGASATLHIGDNLHSDVRMPKTLGIESLAYLPKAESDLRATLKQKFEERGNSIAELLSMHGGSTSVPAGLSGIEQRLYEYGLTCAPLLVGFMLFVMEQAIRQGHEKVYFFTREGEFFKCVYDALRDAQPLGQQTPPSEILEVSRLATFAPSLRAFTPEELMRIWNLYGTQSIAALFKSMNVDPAGAITHLSRHGIDPEEPIRYPWLDQRIIALFNDPLLCEFLSNEVGKNKNSLMIYLEQKGLSAASRKAAIVDIGWRGTIQDNLAYLLPECQFDGYYLGLEKFLNIQPVNCSKAAFGPSLNQAEWAYLPDFFRAVAPVEMLCNSPNGSVIGYKVSGHSAAAERIVDAAENAVFYRHVKYFQKGVIASVAGIAEMISIHAIASNELRPLAVKIWQEIIRTPNSSVAIAYFQLNHNEQFGLGGFEDKRSRIPISCWGKALLSPQGMREFVLQLEATGWPEGYLARSNLLFVWSAIKFLRKLRKYYLGNWNR